MAPFFQKPVLSTTVSCSELAFVPLGISPSLGFLLCKMGIAVKPISQG